MEAQLRPTICPIMQAVFHQMQAVPFQRSSFAQTAAVLLVTFAALVLLGMVLARWTWVWAAPRPEPRAPAVVQTGVRLVSAQGLFGVAQRNGTVAAPTGIAIRLLGIVAATAGHRGYAAVQLDGKQILAVREGEHVAAGIRLAEVGTDRVILERGGIRESLALPEQQTVAAPTTLPTQ